jgi:predicted acyl esterase
MHYSQNNVLLQFAILLLGLLESGSTSFVSDPHSPCEIPGTWFPGATDARAYESQSEVRTFTTDVLQSALEWTGRVRAELFMSSIVLSKNGV